MFFSFSKVEAYRAYITNEKDNTVSVIDINKKKVIETVKVGQRPRGIIMSKDGKLVLICASDDDRVEVRDAETMKLKYHLPSGPDPELFILSPEELFSSRGPPDSETRLGTVRFRTGLDWIPAVSTPISAIEYWLESA